MWRIRSRLLIEFVSIVSSRSTVKSHRSDGNKNSDEPVLSGWHWQSHSGCQAKLVDPVGRA